MRNPGLPVEHNRFAATLKNMGFQRLTEFVEWVSISPPPQLTCGPQRGPTGLDSAISRATGHKKNNGQLAKLDVPTIEGIVGLFEIRVRELESTQPLNKYVPKNRYEAAK